MTRTKFEQKRQQAGAATGGKRDAPPTDANGHAKLLVRPMSELKAQPVRYFVPGRFAKGKLHLIAGRDGSGKSTLLRTLKVLHFGHPELSPAATTGLV